MDLKQQQTETANEAPPPAYNAVQPSTQSEICSSNRTISPSSFTHPPSMSPSNFKPVVIPQTSKSLQGAFISPFARAYSPMLAERGISIPEFLLFIDGLNETLIAGPGLQIASYLGQALTYVPILSPIRKAGSGIQAGAGLACSSSSWGRAKAFVEKVNQDMFIGKGLRCRLLKTEKMMRAVGCGQEVLDLPPLVENWVRGAKGGDDMDEPRMRRVRALGDRISPLRFSDLPPAEDIEGWWKRTGSKEAQKKDRKMYEEVMREREKGCKNEGSREVDEMERSAAQKIYWIVIEKAEDVL